jgi:hypothetical protein
VYDSLGVPLPFPRIVNIDVLITSIAHTTRNHSVSLGSNRGVIDLIVKVIPAIPTHRRCWGHGTLRNQRGCKDDKGSQKDSKIWFQQKKRLLFLDKDSKPWR